MRRRMMDRPKPKSIMVTVRSFFAISTERLQAKKDSTAGDGNMQQNTGNSNGELDGDGAGCGTVSAECSGWVEERNKEDISSNPLAGPFPLCITGYFTPSPAAIQCPLFIFKHGIGPNRSGNCLGVGRVQDPVSIDYILVLIQSGLKRDTFLP